MAWEGLWLARAVRTYVCKGQCQVQGIRAEPHSLRLYQGTHGVNIRGHMASWLTVVRVMAAASPSNPALAELFPWSGLLCEGS